MVSLRIRALYKHKQIENILLISIMINKHLYPPSLRCTRKAKEQIDLARNVDQDD